MTAPSERAMMVARGIADKLADLTFPQGNHRKAILARNAAESIAAALRSYAGEAGVPEGWRLVPAEPTDEMVQGACDATFGPEPQTPEELHRTGYRAMLDAAPQPDKEGGR